MRIASLDPSVTEILCQLGVEKSLVAATDTCVVPPEILLTQVSGGDSDELSLALTPINLAALVQSAPDIVITRVPVSVGGEPDVAIAKAERFIKSTLGDTVKFRAHNPTTLDQVFESLTAIGKSVGAEQRGHDISSRMKAQFMDWGDSFYDRMKNKRVSVISSIEPLTLAGYWVPDMVHLASAVSHMPAIGKPGKVISWEELLAFRPDVILVAPEGMAIKDSMKSFLHFEKLPKWEEIPAVKRGEVFFAEGLHFYHPSSDLLDSMAILISAIAGFDSGYITKRDTFYRLRWLEMQRHRV